MYLRGRLTIGTNSHMRVPNADLPMGTACVKGIARTSKGDLHLKSLLTKVSRALVLVGSELLLRI